MTVVKAWWEEHDQKKSDPQEIRMNNIFYRKLIVLENFNETNKSNVTQ